ncbi:MAG: carboxy terminal-processing peptidase [Pseudomonadota bacterium]
MNNTGRISIVLVVAASLLTFASLATGSNIGKEISTRPTERHARISKMITQLFERNHYQQKKINDALSSDIYDRYLEALDGNRRYLLEEDVLAFEKYRYKLDDYVRQGNMYPVFEMFDVYKARAQFRVSYALDLLETEPDFEIDEIYEFDRTEAPWAKNEAELNEIWRKSVKSDALSLMLADRGWEETQEVLEKRYRRVLKRFDQINSDDIFETFVNAYADTLDPHSSYFSPRNSEEYRIQMSLSYEGIGASLALEDDYVKVLAIIPGGPAAAAETIKPNDRITAVGQDGKEELVDVVGWRLDDVVQLIRGKRGTNVRLQLLRAGALPGDQEEIVTLMRDKVKLEEQAAKSEVLKVPHEGEDISVGVIEIPTFYRDYDAYARGEKDFRSTTADVAKLITELEEQGVEGLIVDLRGNGGGHLREAIELTGLFIESGPVVQLRDTRQTVQKLDDDDPRVAYHGPVAVLVNRFSASASEIFAAAIQDYGRGIVIGQRTYGKGTVQNLYNLDRRGLSRWLGGDESGEGFGQLTLTMGKYYRVSGESTQHRGVMPDIALPSSIDDEDVGESTQETALPWDEIDSTDFPTISSLDGTIASLTQTHTDRVAEDPDFRYLVGRVEAQDAQREKTFVSLNINDRREERESLRQAQLDRENKRRAAQGLEPIETMEEFEASERPDIQLNEAASVVADWVKLQPRMSHAVKKKSNSRT